MDVAVVEEEDLEEAKVDEAEVEVTIKAEVGDKQIILP
jgi:hypothetical protein